MDTKRCSHCKEPKSLLDFGNDALKKDGLRDYCRECSRQFDKAKRARHGKRYNAERRTRCQTDPDLAKAVANRHERWKANNPAKIAFSRRKHHAFRRGKIWELSVEWYLANVWGKKCTYGNHPADGGIDRVDSNKGYTQDNCVPCCYWCNAIKGNHTVEEMYQRLADMLECRQELFYDGAGI